ncbi:MAG TPA: hypothetical protein VKG92_01280 [Flavobacteriales bacterium]|nr:hypothetical protein [Flavobacteriales bacterium]
MTISFEAERFETSIATIVRTRPDMMEIRYKPGSTMDMAGVKEIHEVRARIFGDRPYASLSLIPEDVDFQLDITLRDHYSTSRGNDGLVAWATVARGAMLDMIAKLYFSYFPQTFPVLTTANEQEARVWIEAQLDKNAKSTG